MVDLSVEVNNLIFKSPIVCESAGYVVDEWGLKRMIKAGFSAVITKSNTAMPFEGGPSPRCYWYEEGPTPAMNGSEALLNPGYKKAAEFIRESKPIAEQEKCHIIASFSPRSTEEGVTVGQTLADSGASALHMDLQCPTAAVFRAKQYPNEAWEHLGSWWSEEVKRTASIIKAVKGAVDIPVWPKPLLYRFKNEEAFKILDDAGPDLYAFTNPGPPELFIDIYTQKRKANATPLASRRPIMIRDTADIARLTGKPLLPSGGFENGHDVIEALLVGASLIGFCTAIYRAESEGKEIADLVKMVERQIISYMVREQKHEMKDIIGRALRFMPKKLSPSSDYYNKWISSLLWEMVPGPDSEHPW